MGGVAPPGYVVWRGTGGKAGPPETIWSRGMVANGFVGIVKEVGIGRGVVAPGTTGAAGVVAPGAGGAPLGDVPAEEALVEAVPEVERVAVEDVVACRRPS
jgi:hypothetical protein